MFEILLLMVSVGVQAANAMPEGASANTTAMVAPTPAAPPVTETMQVAPPAFLAPAEPGLVAEPQVPTGKFTTALEVRPILNATRGSWITVREYDGRDLLYVTHLWSWRCGLLELRVGLNGNAPQPWPMPDCHLDQPAPGMILETDGLPYREFGLGSVAMIEVEITYDDLTTDRAKYNRQGVLIQ